MISFRSDMFSTDRRSDSSRFFASSGEAWGLISTDLICDEATLTVLPSGVVTL
jgi:hypothetical protein